MEGRHPPPKASHPFPDSVDLTKFWGTRTATGFFKFSACFILAFGSYLGGNMYLKREEKGLFGFDFSMTKEELEKKKKIMEFRAPLEFAGIPVSFKSQESLSKPELRFDDGIRFDKFTADLPLRHRDAPAESD